MSTHRRSFGPLAALAVAALTLPACGGNGSDLDRAEELCAELAAGTTPFDIFQSMRDEYPDQPDWAAAAKDWAASTCPDQLASNEQLRNAAVQWGPVLPT